MTAGSTRGRRRRLSGGEDGMVTAETAVALTGLMVVLLAVLWVVAVVGMQLRCVDAARDAARAVARGDTVAAARAEALEHAPAGARISFRMRGDRVEVDVVVSARPVWPVLAALPAVPVRGAATVTREPGEPPVTENRQ